MTAVSKVCLTCLSLSGERRISPGPTIHDGRYCVVEHAYPSRLLGWLVIVLKRHAEALHDLAPAEFAELAELQSAAARALRDVTGCAKEYLMCLAEAPGHHHVHFHIVPRAADLPVELKGAAIFAMIKTTEAEAVPPAQVADACLELRSALRKYV